MSDEKPNSGADLQPRPEDSGPVVLSESGKQEATPGVEDAIQPEGNDKLQPGFGYYLGQGAEVARNSADTVATLIKGDFSLVLSPYAAYAIRVVAMIVAVFALFDPFIVTASGGFIGTVQDLVINLVFAYALFVIAEVVIVQRDIASSLKQLVANSNSENPES